jgi:hypothetical protein
MPNTLAITADFIELRMEKRALQAFTRSSRTLLASRLGHLAIKAVAEVFSHHATPEEQRRLALARVATEARLAGIETEDWTVPVLVEIAMQKMKGELDRDRPKCRPWRAFISEPAT